MIGPCHRCGKQPTWARNQEGTVLYMICDCPMLVDKSTLIPAEAPSVPLITPAASRIAARIWVDAERKRHELATQTESKTVDVQP